jgi:tRNA (guanine-N7-)-methyltransferase
VSSSGAAGMPARAMTARTVTKPSALATASAGAYGSAFEIARLVRSLGVIAADFSYARRRRATCSVRFGQSRAISRPPVPFVNPYADAPTLPEGEEIDPRTLFEDHTRPIEIEIGPGRGTFILERLAAAPEARMLGLEIRRKWAFIVDERLRTRGFGGRGRVLAEDARLALPRLKASTACAAFIHFPDPWWKKRHQKRLVASVSLLEELARVLVPGGELFFQTDVEERAEQFERWVDTVPLLLPVKPGPRVAENPYGAMSTRERRAVADGLPIVRLRYVKAR